MKKIFFIISAFLFALTLASCSKSNAYRNDLPASDIARAICDETQADGGYSAYESDHIAFLFDNTALFDDCSVMYSTNVTDINEIGVFHCENKDNAKALTETVSKYISDMQAEQKAFIESYAPRELPKLENAEVREYGNYVIYLIANDEDRKDAIEEIEDMLKE